MKKTLVFALATSCVSVPCLAGNSDASHAISELLKSYVIEQQVSKNTAQFDGCLKSINEQSITTLKKTTYLEAIEQHDKNRLAGCNKIVDSPLRAFSQKNERLIRSYVEDRSHLFEFRSQIRDVCLDLYIEAVKGCKPAIIEWFTQTSAIENKIRCLKKIDSTLTRSAFNSDAEFQQAHDVHAESIEMLERKLTKQFMCASKIMYAVAIQLSVYIHDRKVHESNKLGLNGALLYCEIVAKRAFYHLLGERIVKLVEQMKRI